MRILIAAAALALTLAACSSGGQTMNPPPSPPPAGATACPATITASSSNVYTPTGCTLKVGTPVTIEASATHPLSGSGAGENVASTTTSRMIMFSSAGTFNFVCGNHGAGGMKGTITVE